MEIPAAQAMSWLLIGETMIQVRMEPTMLGTGDATRSAAIRYAETLWRARFSPTRLVRVRFDSSAAVYMVSFDPSRTGALIVV
jgi:hypothetical protein